MATVTVNGLLAGHVGLDIQCLDRIYLSGYVPTLQYGGHVALFMSDHLGLPIPSPAIMEKIGAAFRRAVTAFTQRQQIPLVRFAKTDRKQDVMRPHLARQAGTGAPGVAAVGVAQEFQNVFASTQRPGSRSTVPLLQGRPAGHLLLLLPVERRVRARVHQDLQLLPVSDEGVDQRARVGQAAGSAGGDRVLRAVQRVRHL